MSDDGRGQQTWWNQQLERRIERAEAEAIRRVDEAKQRADHDLNNARQEIMGLRRSMEEMVRRIDRMEPLEKRVERTERDVDAALSKEDFKPWRNGIVAALSAVFVTILGAVMKLVLPNH